MTSRRFAALLKTALLLLSPSCGAKEDLAQKKHPLPSDLFVKHTEPLSGWRQCEHQAEFGCATLDTMGSLVSGVFTFKDIFTRCRQDGTTTTVSIVNSTTTSPTFQLELTVRMPRLGTVVCTEAESRSCAVTFRLHAQHGAATEQRTCLLSVQATAPLSGQLACSPMATPGGTLAIKSGSSFECAQ
jgi:hypothetical protein